MFFSEKKWLSQRWFQRPGNNVFILNVFSAKKLPRSWRFWRKLQLFVYVPTCMYVYFLKMAKNGWRKIKIVIITLTQSVENLCILYLLVYIKIFPPISVTYKKSPNIHLLLIRSRKRIGETSSRLTPPLNSDTTHKILKKILYFKLWTK
jgi:hypothetical protein